MENMAVPFGHVYGVPIRVHVLLPAVAVLAAVGALVSGGGIIGAVLAFIVTGPLVILTVLVHELGHVIAGVRCGCTPDSILLWPLGGLALIDASAIGPKQQIFISAAGPATHLPMLFLWLLLLMATNKGSSSLQYDDLTLQDNFLALMCIAMVSNNIAMAAFNLLVPCFPLDCSQIFLSMMLLGGFEPDTAAKVMVFVSVPVLGGLAIYGILAYLSGSASAVLTIFVAVWMAQSTWKLQQARVQGQLESYPLFANVIAARNAGSGPGATTSGAAPGSFKSFQGDEAAVGKPANTPASSNNVCMGAAISFIISLAVVNKSPIFLQPWH